MKSLKTKNNRNFKPVKISESLKTINQNILYKFGKIDYIIHTKWPEIVGIFFVQHSEPDRITSIPVFSNILYIISLTDLVEIASPFDFFKSEMLTKIGDSSFIISPLIFRD